MKACEYDRRFLRRGHQPHVLAIREGQRIDPADLRCYGSLKEKAQALYACFTGAKEYGSILQVPLTMDELRQLKAKGELIISEAQDGLRLDEAAINRSAVSAIEDLLPQAMILAGHYDAVITNPPYLNKFSPNLKRFVQENYPDYKSDLFSVFMARNFDFCKPNGFSAFMTPFVWMFIKSYEKLRRMMFTEKTPETLVQLEYSAFGEATVPVCGFTLRNTHTDAKGVYFRLTDFKGGLEVQRERFLEAVRNRNCGYVYETAAADFGKLPEAPAAYWVSGRVRELYEKYPSLGSISAPRKGNSTSDNDRFLRFWYEVGFNRINTDCTAIDRAETLEKRWFPYNKGGGFKKWYGKSSSDLIGTNHECNSYCA